MCTYTLHEQYCRDCQKLINSEHLDVQKCQAKLQELMEVRKRIEDLALRQNSAVAGSSSSAKGKGKARYRDRDTPSPPPSPPPLPQDAWQTQNLPSAPSPGSRVRGVKKWLQQQADFQAPQFSGTQGQSPAFGFVGPSSPGALSSNAFTQHGNGIPSTQQQQMATPFTPTRFKPAAPPHFFTPQRSAANPKRKAWSIEEAASDSQANDDPFFVTKTTTPPSAKRHRTQLRQAGRGSAGPHSESGAPVPVNLFPLNFLPSPVRPRSPRTQQQQPRVDDDSMSTEIDFAPGLQRSLAVRAVVVDADGDSDMDRLEGATLVNVAAMDVDYEMSDDYSSGNTVDFDGDICISDPPVYEEPDTQRGASDSQDKSESMELVCLPSLGKVLTPGWGVCDACAASNSAGVRK